MHNTVSETFKMDLTIVCVFFSLLLQSQQSVMKNIYSLWFFSSQNFNAVFLKEDSNTNVDL